LTKPDLNNINGNYISAGTLTGSNWQGDPLVDLNDVFRTVLDKYSVPGGLIFRCDKLPVTNGNSEDFTCLFDALIAMIVAHPPIGSKLYLYVKCSPETVDSEVMDLRVSGGDNLYKIEIYTNITTDKHWEMLYQARLAECNLQAAKIKGNFSFSPVVNMGCVFSLTLAGKIN
jgi:hypothetical protein